MSAISSLPVEVWHAILRYAIEVPLFLDPDAYEGVLARVVFHGRISPLNHECTYWSAEKTRNRMQLVSKSWDSFLRPFEHRFVRMLDIRHGKVPLQKLEMAIRVSFREYDCECVEFCAIPSFFDFLLEALKQVVIPRAEIVDTPEKYILLQSMNSAKLKNIKTFVLTRNIYGYRLSSFHHPLPSLLHFHGGVYYGASDIEWGKSRVWPNLVSLRFSIWPEAKYDPIILDFPCL
jgi:hypothetical protein